MGWHCEEQARVPGPCRDTARRARQCIRHSATPPARKACGHHTFRGGMASAQRAQECIWTWSVRRPDGSEDLHGSNVPACSAEHPMGCSHRGTLLGALKSSSRPGSGCQIDTMQKQRYIRAMNHVTRRKNTSGMIFRGGLQQSEWKALRHLSHSSRGLLQPLFPFPFRRLSTQPQTSQSSRSSSRSCT